MNKILIIEDEKNIRDTIMEILELNNYEIATAENGLIGIAKALQFKPDLIVCDVMMPEMDGFETLKNIRSINEISNTPFVFLTAKTENRDFREGMNSGADDFLNKPFNTQELLKVIKLRIAKSNQAKELFVQEINSLKEEVENLQNSKCTLLLLLSVCSNVHSTDMQVTSHESDNGVTHALCISFDPNPSWIQWLLGQSQNKILLKPQPIDKH